MPEIICIPRNLPGGLETPVSSSFEESEVYTFFEIERREGEIKVELVMMRHSCDGVSCVDSADAISTKATILIRCQDLRKLSTSLSG